MDRGYSLSIISSRPISALYYALLQCGYDYYGLERSSEHIKSVRAFIRDDPVPDFFRQVEQRTCEVYPYWPRAAILETASMYLDPQQRGFADFEGFRSRIMSLNTIAEAERGADLWEWAASFPAALNEIYNSSGFRAYREFERRWIVERRTADADIMRTVRACLNKCAEMYRAVYRDVLILINPIKCVYSSDYLPIGESMLFSSGAFRAGSVVHEFLHGIVHPAIFENRERFLSSLAAFGGIDDSYFTDGGMTGRLNAAEEYAVRSLTETVLSGVFPRDIDEYLTALFRCG